MLTPLVLRLLVVRLLSHALHLRVARGRCGVSGSLRAALSTPALGPIDCLTASPPAALAVHVHPGRQHPPSLPAQPTPSAASGLWVALRRERGGGARRDPGSCPDVVVGEGAAVLELLACERGKLLGGGMSASSWITSLKTLVESGTFPASSIVWPVDVLASTIIGNHPSARNAGPAASRSCTPACCARGPQKVPSPSAVSNRRFWPRFSQTFRHPPRRWCSGVGPRVHRLYRWCLLAPRFIQSF